VFTDTKWLDEKTFADQTVKEKICIPLKHTEKKMKIRLLVNRTFWS